jgi:hypothetical protein
VINIETKFVIASYGNKNKLDKILFRNLSITNHIKQIIAPGQKSLEILIM